MCKYCIYCRATFAGTYLFRFSVSCTCVNVDKCGLVFRVLPPLQKDAWTVAESTLSLLWTEVSTFLVLDLLHRLSTLDVALLLHIAVLLIFLLLLLPPLTFLPDKLLLFVESNEFFTEFAFVLHRLISSQPVRRRIWWQNSIARVSSTPNRIQNKCMLSCTKHTQKSISRI